MSSLIDLRDHFGIWERCGNTRFFRKNPDNLWHVFYLNPLDGILVAFRRTSMLDQEPRYDLYVRNAQRAPDKEVKKTFKSNQPWVKNAVNQFFYYKAMGWALDAIREIAKRPQPPGDRDMQNFLEFYQEGGKRYREEGGSPAGDKPMLEETLEAVLRTIAILEGSIADHGRNLLPEDVDDALADLGIIEC